MLSASLLAATGLCAAALADLSGRRIPNPVVVGIALAGLVRIGADLAQGATSTSALLDLLAASGVLGLGALAYRARLWGGGDAKLLAVTALWLGAGAVPACLAATAIACGVLSLAILARPRPAGHLAAGRAASVPCAVALAVGALIARLVSV